MDFEIPKFSLISFQTGHTALQRAAAEGHLEVVKHLVARGAAVDHQDEMVRGRDGIAFLLMDIHRHLLLNFIALNGLLASPKYYSWFDVTDSRATAPAI